MKYRAKINGTEVDVEVESLTITINEKLATVLDIKVGTGVEILSPNEDRSQFNSNLSVTKVNRKGEYELKYNSSMR